MVPGRTALAVAFSLVVLACGPIEYVNQVTRRASTEVERARQARADQLAPYEYTLAVEYLHKAREEASFADFQAANRFGRKAAESAQLATELAEARAASPEKAARELPPKELQQEGDAGLAPLDDAPPDSDPAPADDASPVPAGDEK